MSLSKIIGSVVTIAALALPVPQANAQHDIHRGRPYIDPDGNDADLVQPFVNPTAFPHDFQFFAPAEFGEFGGGPDPNTGWFATADRVYIYMSRPDPGPTPTEGDFTWGNRFEFGYMSPEDHGWFGEFWHIDGPNEFDITEAERVNVINLDDQINSIPGSIDLRDGGVINMPPAMGPAPQNQGLPRSDQNNPITFDRRYLIRDSVNSAKLTSFELNKSFRLDKFHYGSYFEPFFGFRYMNYKDLWERDTYSRYDELGVNVGQFPLPPIDPTLLSTEQFDELTSSLTNHMVGGQFGARWYKMKGRWNLSSEIRAFAFANFQFQQTLLHQELTYYEDGSAGTVGAQVLGVFLQNTLSSNNTTSFVFGGEVRAEAAYELTRDVSLRFGITFMELGNGVGRGADGQGNVGGIQNAAVRVDQNVTMFGTTFGFDYRR